MSMRAQFLTFGANDQENGKKNDKFDRNNTDTEIVYGIKLRTAEGWCWLYKKKCGGSSAALAGSEIIFETQLRTLKTKDEAISHFEEWKKKPHPTWCKPDGEFEVIPLKKIYSHTGFIRTEVE